MKQHVFRFIMIVVVSLLTKAPEQAILDEFDAAMKAE